MTHLLLSVLLAGIVSAERLEGTWCLRSLATGAVAREVNETWHFAADNAVFVDRPRNDPVRFEGTYDVRGDRITTSLALTFTVQRFDDDRMVALTADGRVTFSRGACD